MTDNVPTSFVQEARPVRAANIPTPADLYGELFVAVQTQRVFQDSKTFVDCIPRMSSQQIIEAYSAEKDAPGFDLTDFVCRHFDTYEMKAEEFVANPNDSLAEHIDRLWPVLTRQPHQEPNDSSLLQLPHQYVVPGGRFTEMYYWDSYFTMLGLDESGNCELLRAMADNFAYLIDTYGHVPNGNRSYYLSRSQPPVFALMTDLFEETGIHRASDYLPQLLKEHAFWNEGGDHLNAGEAHRRCVCLADGSVLNRYWDDRDTPRDESYLEDIETARSSSRPASEVYRDLRAGAESGWDFSSRWLADPTRLSSIRTTRIVPVDLNCFLHYLERQIARLSEVKGHDDCAADFRQRAERRRTAIDRYLWNDEQSAYFDYDWTLQQQRDNLTAATLTPLFVKLASEPQAARVAETVRARLLAPGGLSTTEISGTHEQWDRPNGWAPLQWMGILGLQHYGHDALALQIEERWLNIVSHLFERESKLVEKYVLRPSVEHATGGEYPLQDGFGWTNGVTRKLMQADPNHQAHRCRAGHCQASDAPVENP